MYILNKKMFNLLPALDWGKGILNAELRQIVEAGFIEIEDCYVLKMIQLSNLRKDFVDAIAYECFINSLHIDDYVEPMRRDCLRQGLLFVEEVFKVWNANNFPGVLNGIVSESEFEGSFHVNVKFHIIRPGAHWTDEQKLDDFNQPVLVTRSR